jgi:exodeoxyribonuclease VII large subunit
MPTTYLITSFSDREKVKALGARWDAVQKKWYVPDGRDLAAFSSWLPAPAGSTSITAASGAVAAAATDLAAMAKGMRLSQLLAGVAQAIARSYGSAVWTTVEVQKVDARSGHVYLEVAERDAQGNSIAQARAVIWAGTANQIVPDFERATGMVLGAGIKLLVRAKPTMHALYGLSLVIDGIDPQYSLGDLEARKREIRARLKREGLFEANRRLPQAWDYTAVLVIAPQGAAGLGDFQREAERLQKHGVCVFAYAFSRFQGEGAATEIRMTLSKAVEDWRASGCPTLDAIAVIRGGGAVNDLAWLNDYDLARCICELGIPVLTGIGHERDDTVLDEVANIRFDTPSKVIGGIEQVIRRRAAEVRSNFDGIVRMATGHAQSKRREVELADTAVRGLAQRLLGAARQRSAEWLSAVRVGALQSVRTASQVARARIFAVRHLALGQVSQARQQLPALLAEVRSEARQTVRQARGEAAGRLGAMHERARLDARLTREAVERDLVEVSVGARSAVADASTRSEALMREIAGQGPQKSLARGFAIVRAADGLTLTSASATPAGVPIEIQFRDGRVAARTDDDRSKST